MPISLHWFLPTNGDSRSDLSPGDAVGATGSRVLDGGTERAPDIGYIGQIARSAEQLGFDAALTPTSSWCEEAWIITAALTQVTERLRYLVAFRLIPHPVRPDIYLGGSSSAAMDVAARYADVYLTWGEPPAQVAEKLDRARARAAAVGRTLRFGIRLHVIARDSSDAAWAVADRLLDGLSPEAIARAQAVQRASGSEGQARMVALHGGRTDALEIAPNLWAGVRLVGRTAASL